MSGNGDVKIMLTITRTTRMMYKNYLVLGEAHSPLRAMTFCRVKRP
jgi:hypothetical protein